MTAVDFFDFPLEHGQVTWRRLTDRAQVRSALPWLNHGLEAMHHRNREKALIDWPQGLLRQSVPRPLVGEPSECCTLAPSGRSVKHLS